MFNLGSIHGPKPYKSIGCGDIHGPKPYEITGFGAIDFRGQVFCMCWLACGGNAYAPAASSPALRFWGAIEKLPERATRAQIVVF
jgi:hypothetical protein